MPDALKLYLKDIKDIPLLTPQEEVALARRIKKGDAEARRKMIRANLRLVISIAKRYSYLGMPISDLIEEGNLGLMRAVTKFNPGKGFRFSTYAAWWIKQYVLRAIANQGKTIRIPVYMVDIISRYRKVTERLNQRLGRKPSTAEMAHGMKLPVKKIREIEEILLQPASLDAPLGEEGTSQFIDLVEQAQGGSSKDELAEFLTREQVEDLLGRLTEREQQVLKFRYGLVDGVTYTLGETAKRLGITRERVRQIQNSAEKRLHAFLATQEQRSSAT
ncbi:MAG: sigma-70 family RNA polymerase sigma factor [Candidatus Omnitrophica bacterium]|nr:sigma-70 family RNA polymerase sigma factor [Candidatus Omnitrophota bacterium]